MPYFRLLLYWASVRVPPAPTMADGIAVYITRKHNDGSRYLLKLEGDQQTWHLVDPGQPVVMTPTLTLARLHEMAATVHLRLTSL